MKKFIAITLGLLLSSALVFSNPSLQLASPDLEIEQSTITVVESEPFEEVVIEKTIEEVIEESMPAVVSIEVYQWVYDFWTEETSVEKSMGAGFFINDKGHLITNAHVVEGNFSNDEGYPDSIITWKIDEATHTAKAELLAIDIINDLTLLKLRDNQLSPHYLEFGNSEELKVGAKVIVLGHPLGEMWSASDGIISGKNREWRYSEEGLLQITAPINPGNSGGPLLNKEGKVIGINVGIKNLSWFPIFSGLGYSIPSNTINEFLDKYRI